MIGDEEDNSIDEISQRLCQNGLVYNLADLVHQVVRDQLIPNHHHTSVSTQSKLLAKVKSTTMV